MSRQGRNTITVDRLSHDLTVPEPSSAPSSPSMSIQGQARGLEADGSGATGEVPVRPSGNWMLKSAGARGGADGIRLRGERRNSARFLPASPPGWGRAIPGSAVQSGLASALRGWTGDGRAAIRDVACPCGRVSAEQVEASRVPIGERSSECRCHRPRPATALIDLCRLQRMRPAHGCSGDRHYPSGSRFAIEDRWRRENAGSGPLRGGDRR